MRARVLRIGAALLVLVGLVWFIGPTDERTALVIGEQYGTISAGTKLGVTIGDPWPAADAALRRSFTPAYVQWLTGRHPQQGGNGVTLSDTPILVGDAEASYRDRSWRNGVVTLAVRDGVVMSLSWHYPGPFYFDF
jgi:hypothetical protein